MEEEIIRLDLKKAREEGFEYTIEYERNPTDIMSDDPDFWHSHWDIIIIKKRPIQEQSCTRSS